VSAHEQQHLHEQQQHTRLTSGVLAAAKRKAHAPALAQPMRRSRLALAPSSSTIVGSTRRSAPPLVGRVRQPSCELAACHHTGSHVAPSERATVSARLRLANVASWRGA